MNPYELVTVQLAGGSEIPGEALLSIEYGRGNEPALADILTVGTASVLVKGHAFTRAANPLIRSGNEIKIKAKATGTILWSGIIGTPVTTYRKSGPPITIIPAADCFGVASKTKPIGTLISGSMLFRINSAKNVPSGTPVYTSTLVGANDAAGSSFSTSIRPETHLAAFTIVKDSKRGFIWSSREDARGFYYRANTGGGLPDQFTTVARFAEGTTAETYGYTDLELTDDGAEFVTALTIKRLKTTVLAEAELGPFRDQPSIAAGWPRVEETIECTDYAATNASVQASNLLRTQPLPGPTVKSIGVKVDQNPAILEQDLIYKTVQILHGQIDAYSYYHVINEHHLITASRWKATYGTKVIPPNAYASSRFRPSGGLVDEGTA